MNKELNTDLLTKTSEFFKVMGDTTRLSILVTLLAHDELCVTDLINKLSLNQSTISHQLKILRLNKLVKARRDGRTMYYSLDDDHIKDILDKTIVHINEH